MHCLLCTDIAIRDGKPAIEVAEAFTIAPTPQVFAVGGQPSAAIVAVPVCYQCRVNQLKPVSKTGLVTV